MAVRAVGIGMFSFQGEGALFMGLFVKQRGFESLLVMTGAAIGAGDAGLELSLVHVLMAIRAAFERQMPVVVAVLVAFGAGRLRVFALQRVFGGAVIEVLVGMIDFPAAGNVARFASAAEPGFLESAAVGVHVAVLATAKFESLEEDRLSLRSRLVALLAGDRLMLTGEGVVGSVVIETVRGLPGILRMAARAIGPLLPLVHVLVAGNAFAAESQKGMVEILDLDLGAGAGWNKLRDVALLAGNGLMFSFEGHACFHGVIEAFAVEPNQCEFFAVMVGVAANAIRLRRGTLILVGMKAGVGSQPVLNLNVALQALKAARPGAWSQIVTECTFGHAFQLLVSV
jgi:hypothetical protein